MKIVRRDHWFKSGSALFKPEAWRGLSERELKAIIQRFATREAQCSMKAKPNLIWKTRRLNAIVVYERQFGQAPELFRRRALPRLKSFYVHNGLYLWQVPPNNSLKSDAAKPRTFG